MKEDIVRILKALKRIDEAKAAALLEQWEVVQVTVSKSGLVQVVVDTLPDEEEAERYARIRRAFPPPNADYYIKRWGHQFKGGS